jgi:hypothetical protein
MGWTAGVRFLARTRDFSLLHNFQTCAQLIKHYAMKMYGRVEV